MTKVASTPGMVGGEQQTTDIWEIFGKPPGLSQITPVPRSRGIQGPGVCWPTALAVVADPCPVTHLRWRQ
ncbi:MAG TPA: hypothetical protein VH593_24185 [Ktedonobacteraceae bacterium]